MPIHKCDLCCKEFTKKSLYTQHIQRLTPCYTSPKEVIDIVNDTNFDEEVTCLCCFKVFSSNINRIRHQTSDKCFQRKLIIENKQIKLIKDQEKRIKELEEENRLLQIENSKNIVINTINNSNTNTNSNNTTNINNTYNIVLNKHNCENMDYINDTTKIRIIESSLGSILKLIEEKHFNKERPENSNVYISNLRSGEANKYDGTSWITEKSIDLIKDLYENSSEEVTEMYDDLNEKNKITIKTKKNYDNFIEKKDINGNDDFTKQKIKLLLYNKRDEVIKIKKNMKKCEIKQK